MLLALITTNNKLTRDIFVYQVKNGSWYVSHKQGEIGGFLKNTTKTSSVPLNGWMYYDPVKKDFRKDSYIKIKLTEKDICHKVRVQMLEGHSLDDQ